MNQQLLLQAFKINVDAQFYDLAEKCLTHLPKAVAINLRTELLIAKNQNMPAKKSQPQPIQPTQQITNLIPLENSSIDWEKHVNFGIAGNCFVCGRPFSREESKMMGIGPVCGNWSYSFDPHDPGNKEKLEKLKRFIREKMLKSKNRQYTDLIHEIGNNIGIVQERPTAIQIAVNNKLYWIPRKCCVYYYGAFFVQSWKAKEIIKPEKTRVMNLHYF